MHPSFDIGPQCGVTAFANMPGPAKRSTSRVRRFHVNLTSS